MRPVQEHSAAIYSADVTVMLACGVAKAPDRVLPW